MYDIKSELAQLKNTRSVQRARREKSSIPVVALVGYTNSGKSALMNRILALTEKEEKTVFEAGQGSAAGSAAVSRAELARAMNSLLSRSPDREDVQLRAAAWYWDNQDETAWYYADLIEAAVDHTCRVPAAAEQWTGIG